MVFKIAVEDERGKQLAEVVESAELLIDLIKRSKLAAASTCMKYIDPYADTVFNSLQMEPFLEELHALSTIAESDEEKDLLRAIEQLANMVKEEVHSYLKFYGD
jgi:hypothetical protein